MAWLNVDQVEYIQKVGIDPKTQELAILGSIYPSNKNKDIISNIIEELKKYNTQRLLNIDSNMKKFKSHVKISDFVNYIVQTKSKRTYYISRRFRPKKSILSRATSTVSRQLSSAFRSARPIALPTYNTTPTMGFSLWEQKEKNRVHDYWGGQRNNNKEYINIGKKKLDSGELRTVYKCGDAEYIRVLDKNTNKYVYKKLK